jgi:hypothetical protein
LKDNKDKVQNLNDEEKEQLTDDVKNLMADLAELKDEKQDVDVQSKRSVEI